MLESNNPRQWILVVDICICLINTVPSGKGYFPTSSGLLDIFQCNINHNLVVPCLCFCIGVDGNKNHSHSPRSLHGFWILLCYIWEDALLGYCIGIVVFDFVFGLRIDIN